MNKIKKVLFGAMAIVTIMTVGVVGVSASTENYGYTINPGETIDTYERVITNPAVYKPLTSFQYSSGRYLRVHQNDNENSSICFEGLAEDYDGTCVKIIAKPLAYQLKMTELRRLKYSTYRN